MVILYKKMADADPQALRSFDAVLSFDKSSVEFDNNGFVGKVYANTEAGEYFDDPDNPLPPEPEPQADEGAQQILDILKGVKE